MRLGVKEAVSGGALVPGDVVVEDGRVTAVGASPPGISGTAVPGFVDLQVNGFAGVDFLAADPDGYRVAGEAMARTGVTAYQPTLFSSPPDAYWAALATVASLGVRSGPRILGVHLEGPFLSPAWKGAHDPVYLLPPDLELAIRLCEAGPVTHVTLAPELPGGLELVEQLVARGLVVAIGHSDADAEAAHAAFDRGARAVTHLFNAHRRWQPRDPGLAGAALTRPDVTVTAIVDHVHLAPEAAHMAFLAARGRFALVTDTVAAAGLGPGVYRVGDREIHSDGEAARLADGTLAGSVLTMDRAVRNLVGLGIPLVEAVGAASGVPAALTGRTDLGVLRPGAQSDVVVLDDALAVRRTLVGGVEAFSD